MPATRVSVLDPKASPATDLRPGETHIRLKDDPFYGKVDLGPKPTPMPAARSAGADKEKDHRAAQLAAGQIVDPHADQVDALGEEIKEGRHALDGEEQNHVEVLTGKRLQQKTLEARDPEPDVPVEPTHPIEGGSTPGKPTEPEPKKAAKSA